MTYKLYCDAGSLGNPGYAYGSYRITSPNGFRQERSRIKLSDFMTNNQAEYSILIKALEQFRETHDGDEMMIFSDSKLMVQQVTGRWKTKCLHISELKSELLCLLKRWQKWQINWVPREQMVDKFGH